MFAVYFNNCSLNYTYFFKKKLQKTKFDNCQIQEANFTEADLTGASFNQCDLLNTVFEQTNLSKADFRSAEHFAINPEKNTIKKAKFSYDGLRGLLYQYDIVIE